MRWEESTSDHIGSIDRQRAVVVLPVGSVEQHGKHLPVGTDSILAHRVSQAAAEALPSVTVAVLPPPWYGFSTHHMRFPGTITLSADTLMRLVGDIVDSAVAQGFRRILVVNGHGGNGGVIDVVAANLGHRFYGKARVASVTYFLLAREEIAQLRESEPGGMGHAGEFETAMMMHVAPKLAKMERASAKYPDPGSTYLTTDLLQASPVRTYLDFKDLSDEGVFGDPGFATPEKGAAFFDAVAAALARFIADFATWPVERTGR